MCSVSTSRSAPATGMPACLQRADDRLEQRAALAHQNEDVAGAHRVPLSPSPTRSPRSSHVFTAAAICRASLTRGLVSELVSNGASHGIDLAAARPARPAARVRPGRALPRAPPRATVATGIDRQAGVRGRLPEHHVDRVQHDRHRAERVFERDRTETAARRCSCAASKNRAHLGEGFRRRALEREDRLLVVADREDRAPQAAARAGAGGELGDEALDDVPLLRARVLRLVDQQMVDAEIELVVHPGRFHAVQQIAAVWVIRSS